MKRRNFIKTIGAGILSIPVRSESNMIINHQEIKHDYLIKKLYKPDYKTGFDNIDSLISGISNGDLFVVAARPSTGKSIFVNNIIKDVVNSSNTPILCLSNESEFSFYKRYISSYGTIKYNKVYPHVEQYVIDNNVENIDLSLEILLDHNITFVKRSISYTTYCMSHLISEATNRFDIKFLVIDSVNIGSHEIIDNDYQASIPILKKLAVDLNIPIIFTCGLNRNLEERIGKRPRSTDLDKYYVFYNYADTILFLYRDEIYNEHCKDENRVDVFINKARHGSIGQTMLEFDRDYMRFKDYCYQDEK